jgi:elongation factor Ts
MADISASLVKSLREKTGAGMMDCKKALQETSGNFEEAVDWLRKKGLAAASKKSGRVAAEGLIAVASQGSVASLVEVNAETDFVGRNPEFQVFVENISKILLQKEMSLEELETYSYAPGVTVTDELTRLIAVIGENMTLRRVQRVSVSKGVVATYVHSAVAPNLGRIGVLVALESSTDSPELLELGKKLAMHVAAANPLALSIQDVDPAILEREKNILREQALASGRPEDVVAKMLEGRIRKYYEEIVFLEQAYVMDGKTKVSDVLAEASKKIGAPVTLKCFARYTLGEGIEKAQNDFAAEVQAQAHGKA